MSENLNDKIRKNMETLFRFTEKLHRVKQTPEKDARDVFEKTIQPLIEKNYFNIKEGVISLGANAPSEQDARRLRILMNHFLTIGIIWDAWEFEQSGKVDRRKKVTKGKRFSYLFPIVGIIGFNVDRDRILSISNKLAERGLLEKFSEGRRNVYRLSPWFRAYFPALLEKIKTQTAEDTE